MSSRTLAALLGAGLAILCGSTATSQAAGPAGDLPGHDVSVSSLPGNSVPPPSKKGGTYTARILIGTAVRRRPGGKSTIWYASGETRWSGSEQRLMVLSSREVRGGLWLKVRLPIRPNGAAGWIPRDRVWLSLSRRFIEIDTSRRSLKVYRRGRVIARFRVVVGAPATPTPLGLFAIYDRVKQGDPNGFTGPWVLPITAHSRVLSSFDGGPGVVGLHGRDGASLLDPLGTASSHGCVRMNNTRIRYLSKFMKGTAVRIRR